MNSRVYIKRGEYYVIASEVDGAAIVRERCAWVCVWACTCVCVRAYVCARVCVCLRACVGVCMHAYERLGNI